MSARIFPFAVGQDNPYITMLMPAARADGYEVHASASLNDFLALIADAGTGDVMHVNWTSQICQYAPDREQAQAQVDLFIAAVTRAVAAGASLLWTVHNALPHELNYLEQELQIARFLAATSHRIIEVTPGTAAAVSHLYLLPPAKVITLPHASYLGVYPDGALRATARQRLGVGADSPTVAFLGQIRPYKGVPVLLAAIELVAQRIDDVTLLLAGRTSDDQVSAIERALPVSATVIHRSEFIADDELQYWFAAADIAVFPYRAILNSGSLMLAATFGTPAVLPALEPLHSAYGDQDWVTFYEPGTESDDSADEVSSINLASTIEASLAGAAATSAAAREFARGYTASDMSSDYLRILAGLGSRRSRIRRMLGRAATSVVRNLSGGAARR